MAETRLLERLTASDLFMLWADDFGWSQDIGVLAILDGTRLLDGDGRVRIEAVRRAIEPRLPLVPRFRQLLYRPRRGLGWPLWVDAQSFDLADVAGGLRQLLASRGEDVQELVLRAMVPISLHHEQPGQARGNQDGMMLVPLALGEPDAVRRLDLIAAETTARKHKAHPQVTSGIFRFVAVQRASYRLLPRQRSVNLSVTNVPGPPVPLYLAGARLLELFPVPPIQGNVTLTVGVLSYAGQLNLTAIADRDTCPDVELFAQGVRSALDDLTRSVLVPAS